MNAFVSLKNVSQKTLISLQLKAQQQHLQHLQHLQQLQQLQLKLQQRPQRLITHANLIHAQKITCVYQDATEENSNAFVSLQTA